MLRFAAIALALSLASAGCAGSDTEAATAEEVESRSERKTYEDSKSGEDRDGWQWKGRRQDCFFLHENECYSALGEACQAAGCSEDSCSHDDSAPAVVSCAE